MHTFDVNIEFNSEVDVWSIYDDMTAITNILIDQVGDTKEGLRLLKSFWHSTLPIYCIEQCTSNGDNPEFLPWILVKLHLNATILRGRIPKWYNWISTQANLHKIPCEIARSTQLTTISKDRRIKDWVFSASTHSFWIGRIKSKSTSGLSATSVHWIKSANLDQDSFMKCKGCDRANQISETNDESLIRSRTSQIYKIADNCFHYNITTHRLWIDVQQLFQSHINTAFTSTGQNRAEITIEVATLEVVLINAIIKSDRVRGALIQLWIDLRDRCKEQQLVQLSGYTDGSVNFKTPSRNNQVIMGSGWIIPEVDMSFGMATILWPSSTKAELSAILLLLLVLPAELQSVTIYTDSQAAIDNILKYSSLSIRAKLKIPNMMIIDQIWRILDTKQLQISMVKVKMHSGNVYNDMADNIAKDAATKGMTDPDSIFQLSTNPHSRLRFLLLWKNDIWDGSWRKNLLTLSTLQHNADWAMNNINNTRSVFPWFNEQLDNVIPQNILNTIRTDSDIQRVLLGMPNTFIRWDYTWNFFKTSRHRNRYGPSASNTTSFAIKTLNNYLPTGDNLAKRNRRIYADWTCLFCEQELETLEHLLSCPNLATRLHTIEIARTHNIMAQIPDHINQFFPPIGDPSLHLLPDPIKLLAMGVFLAFLRSDMLIMRFSTNIGPICSELLDFTIKKFRETIWKPRCDRNANRERMLGISAADKRRYSTSNSNNSNRRTDQSNDPSYYHTLLERWKTNHKLGLQVMNVFINRGYHGLNYGWATTRSHIHNWNKHFSQFKEDDKDDHADTQA